MNNFNNNHLPERPIVDFEIKHKVYFILTSGHRKSWNNPRSWHNGWQYEAQESASGYLNVKYLGRDGEYHHFNLHEEIGLSRTSPKFSAYADDLVKHKSEWIGKSIYELISYTKKMYPKFKK